MKSSIVEALDPPDAVAAGLALRYTDCCWNIARHRRAAAGTINITYAAALRLILSEYAADGIDGRSPEEIARTYFSDPKIRALALAHLRRFAIDDSAITAQAFAMRSREISIIDEMQARAEIQALALLREYDRRREAAARRSIAQLATAGKPSQISAVVEELHQ
jgi:hypothetical protein